MHREAGELWEAPAWTLLEPPKGLASTVARGPCLIFNGVAKSLPAGTGSAEPEGGGMFHGLLAPLVGRSLQEVETRDLLTCGWG